METSSEQHVILGTGPLGMATMRALLKRRYQVRMVNRSGSANVPQGVEVVAGDVYSVDSVRDLTADAAVVYQCAQPGYTDWVTHFPAMQAAIIEGVAANGSKLILAENLYMYGQVDGPIHEDLPHNAHTRKGRVRAAMAESAMAAHAAGKIRVAAVRGSDFYGPGVEGSMLGDRVWPALLQGKTVQAIGNIDLPHTYTVIDDFGEALAIVGENDNALGQAWHVPNPPTLTTRQIIMLGAEQLSVTPKINAMGRFMMRMGGLFIPEARETYEMMYEFEQPFVVDHSKFVQAFGNIATPHAEAIAATLDWYRQHLAQPV